MLPCENCNGEGCDLCKLQNLLARGYQLINRSINMMSHGKPTVEEAELFMRDVESALPDLFERILALHTF